MRRCYLGGLLRCCRGSLLRRCLGGLLLVALATITLVACGGGNSSTSTTQNPATSGTVYVTGSDAPLASVVGFQVTIKTLTLSDGTNTYQVLQEPTTIDFSRLLGLRTLLALNQVPAGTYTSATATIENPQISYLNLSGAIPAITTLAGYFGQQGTTSTSVQVALNPNLTISDKGIGGLHFHFNLRDSIVTQNGEITGNVVPQIQLRTLRQGDDDCHIDELLGGVVSVDAANNQFVMQRWHGRNITVKVNTETEWSGVGANNWDLASLQQNYIVEISGAAQADGSILADSVEIVSLDRFYLGGLVLQVQPASGPADNFTMFVRTEMPDLQGISVPGTATLNVTDNTNFRIRWFITPISGFVFNRSLMVVGQRVGVSGTVNPDNSLNVRNVVLHRQGLEGQPDGSSVVITGSGDKEGSFMLQNNGMFGYILGGNPIKVYTSPFTVYKNLPNHLNDIKTMSGRVRMWGMVLNQNGQPVYVAGYIEKLNN